jgi:hypothetical protein
MGLEIGMEIAALLYEKEKYQEILKKISSAKTEINRVDISRKIEVPNVDITCCPQDLINTKIEVMAELLTKLRAEATSGTREIDDLKREINKRIAYCKSEITRLENERNGNNTRF